MVKASIEFHLKKAGENPDRGDLGGTGVVEFCVPRSGIQLHRGLRTYILLEGRPSMFLPFHIKFIINTYTESKHK